MAIAQPDSKPKITYTWTMAPDGPSGEPIVNCSPSFDDNQVVPKLWEAEVLSSFHDAGLAHCTRKINAILRKAEKENRDRKRKLSVIIFDNRPLLVWAHYCVIGRYDDHGKVLKELGLKKR